MKSSLKKLIGVVVLGGIGTSLSSCGEDTTPYSATLGKCVYTSNGVNVCGEFNFSGNFVSDPTAELTATTAAHCAKPSTGTGAWTAKENCSRTGSVGNCTFTQTQTAGSQSVTVNGILIYPTGYSVSSAQSSCATSNGVFSTK